ncbi:uncharacterized protein LOC128998662 [Macrosteles quadrilineatus]|uniref:uncharacterized protein LOC128998662 n=1 Tax=Macrosteles quadrilineatus TaxID=74068 RepID=UPI0023E13D5D|nr:uncharacterized protein LOC128998662 [Macrosteles quadrilineatus]
MGFLRTPNENKILPDPNQVPVAIIEPSSSSDEEEVIEPIRLPEHQPRRPAQPRRKLVLQALQDGISCRNCKVGRRWSRRIDNNAFLQNLLKGEELHDDIIEQEPTVFERLMCNEDAMKAWENFMCQPEEEQHAFLTKQFAKVREAKARCAQEMSEKQPDGRPDEGRKYFKRICPLVQKFLNSEELPKGTLLSLEPCIHEFFLAEPTGQYISDPLGNDDRKVLHGLAQYMDLNSQSFNSELSCDHRCTKVTNSKDTFTAPAVLLSEFLGIS